mmetsp:Transcript_12814/g.33943  ORF Transcript_12814/g.33943 Transcript_12814/m.33943 type:complete len:215 (+) Transcript_12814:450-1094(+)
MRQTSLKRLKSISASARVSWTLTLPSSPTHDWRSTSRHTCLWRLRSRFASRDMPVVDAGIAPTTAPTAASIARSAKASDEPSSRSTATTRSPRAGSSNMGRPSAGPDAQTWALDRLNATRRNKSSNLSSATGSCSLQGFWTQWLQKPSVASESENGSTPRKRSSPFRSWMPCVSGVPLTIHLDVVCKAAQVRATAVFGDETICISSSTTRVHLI